MSAYSRVSSAMSRAFAQAMVTKAPATIGTASATTTLSHVPTPPRYSAMALVFSTCGPGSALSTVKAMGLPTM